MRNAILLIPETNGTYTLIEVKIDSTAREAITSAGTRQSYMEDISAANVSSALYHLFRETKIFDGLTKSIGDESDMNL